MSFKIYADSEAVLKGVKSSDKNNSSYTGKYQIHIPCSFSCKFICIDNKFSKKIVFYRGKNAVYRFIKQFLKNIIIVKKMIKICFNKNLIMSTKDEERFQLSNTCWICGKLFDVAEDKVRDHCHARGKYRGSAHWSCNINLKLTRKNPVIFHNLRNYGSHLINNARNSRCNTKWIRKIHGFYN